MKRKIIALLMATVSAASLLASCDGAATTAACKKHTDFDTNAICDLCGKEIAVINTTEQLQKEERVPMVKKEIPTDAKIGDFIDWEKAELMNDGYTITGTAVKKEEGPDLSEKDLLLEPQVVNGGMGYFLVYGEEGRSSDPHLDGQPAYIVTYAWYSADWKLLYEFKAEDTARAIKHDYLQGSGAVGGDNDFEFDPTKYNLDYAAVEIFPDSILPTVVEATFDKDKNDYVHTFIYYSPVGEKLATYVQPEYEYGYLPPVAQFLKQSEQYAYIAIEDTVYVFDRELKVVRKEEKDTLIYRPDFDEVFENKGYVFTYDPEDYSEEPQPIGLYVYDLSYDKWINCVYEKQFPDEWLEGDITLLNNGNLLVQYTESLMPSAVNYDYAEYGMKYDVHHVLVDVATGEEKEIELGWYIEYSRAVPADTGFVEKVGIMAQIVPIENDVLNTNATKMVLMDNELNILVLINDDTNAEMGGLNPIVKGVYAAEFKNGALDVNGNEYTEYKYLNENMEEIDVTGFTIEAEGKYLMKDGKVYAWSDLTNAKADLSAYTFVRRMDSFAILTDKEVADGETAKYYYFSFNTFAAPVEIQGYKAANSQYGYFMVEKESERKGPEGEKLMDYVMYDCNNQVIGTFEANVSRVSLREDCWEIELANGEVWTVAHDLDVTL
ncbi:MAG: hypothetical protein J6A63_10210 [Clostridia bacterium]|nr:hypothetical protein [Clostridia bacterium]